jgi:uncharacterized membrane protein YozB (DUF420 family)
MILLKIVFVFCGVAIALAALGDLALYLLIRGTGGIGIGFENIKDFNRIPVFVLSALWFFSLLLGWIVARRLNLIPRI